MDEFLKELSRFGDLTDVFSPLDVALVLSLSFVLGMWVAWTYKFTHKGISYSQSFAHTLVIMGVVVGLIMLVIGSNIARAFALVGALSIIRFRNAVKESRDVAFVFYVMAVGMATGTRFYGLAVFSAIAISAFYIAMFKLNLFAREFRERILRAEFPPGSAVESLLGPAFEKYAEDAALIAVESAGEEGFQDWVYSLRLRRKARAEDLIAEVRKASGGGKVTLIAGFQETDL